MAEWLVQQIGPTSNNLRLANQVMAAVTYTRPYTHLPSCFEGKPERRWSNPLPI